MNSYRLCAVKLGFKDISFRSNVKNVLCYLGYRLLVRNNTSSLLAGASYPFTKGAFYPKYVGIFIDAVNFFINKSLKIWTKFRKYK